MIQKLHIALFLLLSTAQAFSQGFARSYQLEAAGSQKFSATRNAIETPAGNYIMIGLTHDTASTNNNLYFATNNNLYTTLSLLATDAQGNVLWRKNYHSNAYNYIDQLTFAGAVAKTASGFYHALSVKNQQGGFYGLLLKFDYNGDTLWQKKFVSTQPGGTLQLTAISKSADGRLLLSALTESGIVTIKTDINGTELWRNLLLSAPATPSLSPRAVYKTVQDSATKKIVHLAQPQQQVYISDSLGNALTSFSLTSSYSTFVDMIQTQDKNFVAAGGFFSTTLHESNSNPVPTFFPYAVKFSLSGTHIWDHYDYENVCYGYNIGCSYGAVCEKANGELILCGGTFLRLSATGTKLEQRHLLLPTYCPANYGGYAMSIDQLAGGGFIIAKHGESSFASCPSPYMLVKIDDSGCDSTTAYCTLVDDIKTQSGPDGFSMNLFPNPAGDMVSVGLKAAAEKAVVITVIDLVGALLKQVEAKTNTDTQLSLSEYKAGVYFVQVCSEGRIIGTKRLLITR